MTGTNWTWRSVAAPRIAAVLRACEGQDEKALRTALRAAYPFGERRHYPYKVWLDEIKRQLHECKPKTDPNQMDMLTAERPAPLGDDG